VTGWAADGRRRVNSLMPRLRDLAGVMLGQRRSASVVAAVQNGVQCTASFPNPRFFGTWKIDQHTIIFFVDLPPSLPNIVCFLSSNVFFECFSSYKFTFS